MCRMPQTMSLCLFMAIVIIIYYIEIYNSEEKVSTDKHYQRWNNLVLITINSFFTNYFECVQSKLWASNHDHVKQANGQDIISYLLSKRYLIIAVSQ